MEHLFIINPAAGKYNRTDEFSWMIRQICGKHHLRYQIAISDHPGDCTRIAREAAQTGKDLRIYACGGDGTLNEIVSGVAGFPNVAITHFAGGTGNDFIKVFSDTEPFKDLEQLLDCEETTFDLIDCNGDYGLNVCSVGLDARVGTQVAAYKRLPLVTGTGAYLLSALVNVIRGIASHYVVEVDGERIDGMETMVFAGNGICYGGGFRPVPQADPRDGKLDVLVVKKVSRLQVARLLNKYKTGQFDSVPHLIRHFRTDSVRIICDKETDINLDGELRLGQDIRIRIADAKIRFFYPRSVRVGKAGGDSPQTMHAPVRPAANACKVQRKSQLP